MDMFFYYFKLKITKSNAKFSEFIPRRDENLMRHIYAQAGCGPQLEQEFLNTFTRQNTTISYKTNITYL